MVKACKLPLNIFSCQSVFKGFGGVKSPFRTCNRRGSGGRNILSPRVCKQFIS